MLLPMTTTAVPVEFQEFAEDRAKLVGIIEVGSRVVGPAVASICSAIGVYCPKMELFFKRGVVEVERYCLQPASSLPRICRSYYAQPYRILRIGCNAKPKELWSNCAGDNDSC